MTLKVNQKVLHQSADDYIVAKYLFLQGTNFEIGKKLGELARSEHFIQRPIVDKEQNISSIEYFRKNYPVHLKRMKGLAKAYGNDSLYTNVDFSSYGCPVSQTGCSAIFFPSCCNQLNSGIISRNADLPLISFDDILGKEPSTKTKDKAVFYILEQHPDNCYASIGVFCFELYGTLLDGVNSEGLMVVHLAASIDDSAYNVTKKFQHGIYEMLSVQLLLDTCKNTEEAKKCLLSHFHYVIQIPIHLLVADNQGNSFIWELDENGNQHFTENKNSPQIVTNFEIFKYPEMNQFPYNNFAACPFNRFRTIHNMTKVNSLHDYSSIKSINKSVFISDNMLPINFPNKVRTLYHQIYNANEREIQVSFYCKDKESEGLEQDRTEYFTFNISRK